MVEMVRSAENDENAARGRHKKWIHAARIRDIADDPGSQKGSLCFGISERFRPDGHPPVQEVARIFSEIALRGVQVHVVAPDG